MCELFVLKVNIWKIKFRLSLYISIKKTIYCQTCMSSCWNKPFRTCLMMFIQTTFFVWNWVQRVFGQNSSWSLVLVEVSQLVSGHCVL